MTTFAQLKLVAAAVLLCIAAFLIYDYTTLRGRNDELKTSLDQVRADLDTERSTRETQAKEFARRADVDAAIRKERTAINSRMETAIHESPAARDYLGERIPDVVRDAHLGR